MLAVNAPHTNTANEARVNSGAKFLSVFNLALREQIYMNNTIMPPTNKMVIVKNIQLNFIWARISPTIKEIAARLTAAPNGEFRDNNKTIISIRIAHNTIKLQ